ncbi:hypothetical protein ACGFYE_15565 [Streptomyces zaomyceticus]|uniref:hypothetical protein n=1 Tax=Streptomyces zaomyceticus TaxID=68286 RepID=UPI00371C9E28
MSQTPAMSSVDPSAYSLDLEMSLLLPSSASASWSPAVHEAARLIGRSWQEGESKPTDLLTLALLLFARTHTGARAPQDVPVAELRAALSGPVDREPQIIDEIDRALTETGQGYTLEAEGAPLWDLFNTVRNQYGSTAAGTLADDIEPPRPGPSPMRAAAARLARLLAGYPDGAREEATAPLPEPGILTVRANRFQIVSRSSVIALRCPYGDDVAAVRVDGPKAIVECVQGHTSASPRLDAARVRMAVARATGARPSAPGSHLVPELLIASTALARHIDPVEANVFLRTPSHPIVGRDDVLRKMNRIIDRRG